MDENETEDRNWETDNTKDEDRNTQQTPRETRPVRLPPAADPIE